MLDISASGRSASGRAASSTTTSRGCACGIQRSATCHTALAHSGSQALQLSGTEPVEWSSRRMVGRSSGRVVKSSSTATCSQLQPGAGRCISNLSSPPSPHKLTKTFRQSASMENTGLLGRLPPELRNRIYNFALVQTNAIRLEDPSQETTCSGVREVKLRVVQPAPTRACRVIREETLPVFYGAANCLPAGRRPTARWAAMGCWLSDGGGGRCCGRYWWKRRSA